MSVLDALNATRVCARGPRPDDSAWALPVPIPERRASSSVPVAFSWRALARNPQALLLSGMVAASVLVDAGQHAVRGRAAR